MHCYEEYKIPPCPNCGKERGATMSKSQWTHNMSCCSDECGIELGKKLNELRNSKKWKKAKEQIRRGYEIMDEMEMELMGQTDQFRRGGFW